MISLLLHIGQAVHVRCIINQHSIGYSRIKVLPHMAGRYPLVFPETIGVNLAWILGAYGIAAIVHAQKKTPPKNDAK